MPARRLLVSVAATAALLALSSCSLLFPDTEPSTSASASERPSAGAEPGVADVYAQELTWSRCGELECATVQVPLDWDNPDGETIPVVVNRHEARDPQARIGSLLINPGGPGGSGLELNEYFVDSAGEKLLDSYDIVGFDPRGVGASSPIRCGDGESLDRYYLQDYALQTQADVDDAVERTQAFAQECRELSGPVIEHVSTVEAARDLDVIRAALGDEVLHYLGFSYGTQLGATYAELYPENVGRLVLDGAVDFLLPGEEQSAGQARGFERALGNFIDWCLAQSDCPLIDDPERARRQIRDIALTARDEGYPSDTTWPVNGNMMVYGIVVTLYDQETWPYLSLALEEVIDRGTARFFYELGNFYLDRDGATGEYLGNSTVAFTAIGCLDVPDPDPWDIAQVRDFREQMDEASPTFGWWFATGTGCDGWPWLGSEFVTSLDQAAAAAPMLVVGTTNDPATPYAWAESLADRLDAPLLTWDGEGHTAYGRSNQCVIDVVDAYLVDGTVPEDTTC